MTGRSRIPWQDARSWASAPFILGPLFPLLLSPGQVHAQPVIINEVSNGPDGTKEYVELLVVDTTVSGTCAPPCLDLRGWIFDDNNGYHGPVGVATGAVRFSGHPLWSCVPPGTIVLLYNPADRNPAIPPDDLSLTDGDCRVVVSLNDLTYFEFTNTTPAPVPCDYPATGWGMDPTPTWASNAALANTGDCARIADLGGCQVFSVCYGTANQNQTVYFNGNGTAKVWYFSDGDPRSTANWGQGCAGCATDTQTPGAPNNAANAAYIERLRNGCAPVAPFTASAMGRDGCGCEASATASASGSVPPFTYAWFDAALNAVGQNSAAITGLCAGRYTVVVTSSTGCVDTAHVALNTLPSADAGRDTSAVLCPDDLPVDLFSLLGGATTPGGSWRPTPASGSGLFDPLTDPPGGYMYMVSGPGLCPDTSVVTVSMAQSADATIVPPPSSICANGPAFNLTAATPGGIWSGTGVTDPIAGVFDPSISGTGRFPIINTIAGPCGDADTVTVLVVPAADATITRPPALCVQGPSLTLNAATPGGTWSGTGITDVLAGVFDPAASGPGTFIVRYDLAGPCPASDTVQVVVVPLRTPSIASVGPFCANAPLVPLTASIPGGRWSGPGITDPSLGLFDPSLVGAGTVRITYALTGPCGGSGQADILVNALPTGTVLLSDTLGCAPLGTTLQVAGYPPGASCAWDLGDGNTNLNCGPIVHVYTSSGCRVPVLTITDLNGCAASFTARAQVCAEPSPTAILVHTPERPNLSEPWVLFSDRSIGATDRTWTIDGSIVSRDVEFRHTFGTRFPAEHLVCLIASNGTGCVDTTCHHIRIEDEFRLHVPNAFTPDGDGVNDGFGVRFSGPVPRTFDLRVFDRWGREVFRTADAFALWDGRHDGVEPQQGVYVWRLIYSLTGDALSKEVIGHVVLLR